MKKIMKSAALVLLGVVIGTAGVSVSEAQSDGQNLSVWQNFSVKYLLDGKQVALPADQASLNYNGRLYVPVRFLSEQLGLGVAWDSLNSTVSLTSPKPAVLLTGSAIEPPKTCPEPVTPAETLEYKALPQTQTYADYELTVTTVTKDEFPSRVYVKLENKEADPIQLVASETKAVIDGKEFLAKTTTLSLQDSRWYDDIAEDEDEEGYIAFPKISKDAKNMHIEFTVLTNNAKQEKKTISFDVKID